MCWIEGVLFSVKRKWWIWLRKCMLALKGYLVCIHISATGELFFKEKCFCERIVKWQITEANKSWISPIWNFSTSITFCVWCCWNRLRWSDFNSEYKKSEIKVYKSLWKVLRKRKKSSQTVLNCVYASNACICPCILHCVWLEGED